MPFLRRHGPPEAPLDPSRWLPQPIARGRPKTAENVVIEPCWGGVRVLIRVDAARWAEPLVTDELGVDCSAEFAAVAHAVAAALRAEEAVLDGYLTVEPTQDPVGMSLPGLAVPTVSSVARQNLIGERGPRVEAKPALDPDRPIAFVAADLLSIDRSSLLDVPLLERKRLLDGALEVGQLVRITPYVRPPIGTHEMTWRAQGFVELVFKSANGHYSPNGVPGDWVILPIRSR